MKGNSKSGINITVHYVKGIVPKTHLRVACCLQVGQDILRVDSNNLCFFATKGLKAGGKTANEVNKAVTVGNMNQATSGANRNSGNETEGFAKTAASATALLEFNENKSWIKDIEASYKDASGKVITNAYLIIQLLEKREGAYPKKVTNREMLEEDYELLGYTVLQMNLKDGSLAYGTYYLQFFEGPIFIEELDPDKKMNSAVKITIKPINFKAPQGDHFSQRPNNLKAVRDNYDSYVVERKNDEVDLPSQNVKTPESVNTTHRINNNNLKKDKELNFAEFSKALGSEGKF